MRKIVFIIVAAFTAQISFGGWAWYSTEINSILSNSLFSEQYKYLQTPIYLYGKTSNGIWEPPYAKINSITGEIILKNNNPVVARDFFTLNNFGKYDPVSSLNNFNKKCRDYIVDEFGQPYEYFSEEVANFYTKYEMINTTAAINAFDQLKAKFSLYINELKLRAESGAYDASGLSERIAEINSGLDAVSDKLRDTVNEVQNQVERFNSDIRDAQENLLQVSNEAVSEAQRLITGSVDDFNSFLSGLEKAIASGDDWKKAAEDAAYSLNDSTRKVIEAIEKLKPYSSDEHVRSAIDTLTVQKNTMIPILQSLVDAIDNDDKEALDGIKERASDTGINGSRKANQRINNANKEYASQMKALRALQNAAIGTVDYMGLIDKQYTSLRDDFNRFIIEAMDNFHQINAYLGSTNSMAYVIKRDSANSLSDFTPIELARWAEISSPDKIDDAYGFGASQYGGRQWNFIYDNLASTYMTWAWPLVEDDSGDPQPGFLKFMEHFNLTGLVPRYKGFVESIDYDSEEHPQTNWVANGITAPKNWADGTTIIMTNGKFMATGNLKAHWEWENRQ